MQVEGITFKIKLEKHSIAKKLIPNIKTTPVTLHFIIMKHCMGLLFQVFSVHKDSCMRKNLYTLILNQYSTLPDIPKIFPYFNNVAELANIVETDCLNEIVMGPFVIKYNPKKKLELFCGEFLFCEEIFNCNKKYTCIESIGKFGLTFHSRIKGTVCICGSRAYEFTGEKFVSYLEVTKPTRFCNKRIEDSSSSSSSSSESDAEFETSLIDVPPFVIPKVPENKNDPQEENETESEESEEPMESDTIDDEEYFYIKKQNPGRNMFSNPFMPNWKLNDNKDVVEKFIEKKSHRQRKNTNVQTASNTNVNVPKPFQRRNPFEPNPLDVETDVPIAVQSS